MEIKVIKTTNQHYEEFKKAEIDRARVLAIQKKVLVSETVLFQHNEGTFQYVSQKKTYGISITNKRYCRIKIERALYVKGWKSFYLKRGNKLMPAYLPSLLCEEKKLIYDKFPFLKFLEDENIYLSLNVVFKNKLFTPKKAIAFLYKEQYTEELHYLHKSLDKYHVPLSSKKKLLSRFENIHRFNKEILPPECSKIERGDIEDIFEVRVHDDDIENITWSYLYDCSILAESLNRKLNATWGFKRLVAEHDEMSFIVTNYLYEATNSDLKIGKSFYEFATYLTEGILIQTSKDLAYEGLKQKHCVGSYADRVNKGSTAIYHYKGYTLQVSEIVIHTPEPVRDSQGNVLFYPTSSYDKELIISQLLGRKNTLPPPEIREEIQSQLNKYNHDKRSNERISGSSAERNEIQLSRVDHPDVDFDRGNEQIIRQAHRNYGQ
jgi:hypothetical protein